MLMNNKVYGGINMDKNSLWNIFARTGNIEAYMLYCELKDKKDNKKEERLQCKKLAAIK